MHIRIKKSYMTPLSSSKTRSSEQIDHTHFLVKNISKLYLSDMFSDVDLVVDGERLPAHRVVLASHSEYFRILFFGGHKEAYGLEMIIKEQPVTLFKIVLKYIYTGQMNLSVLKDKEVFELLRMSDYFGISNLKISLHKYLQRSINIHNVCSFFAMTRLYQYKELEIESLNFVENNVTDVLKSEDFLSLSSEALQEILNRDTFYANEIVIFHAVCHWINENQDQLDPDTKIKVLSAVRYPLMSVEERSEARESHLVSSDIISDAMQLRNTWSPDEHAFRGQLKPNVSLAYQSQSSSVTNLKLIHQSQGFSVLNNNSGINIIKLNNPSTINFIELTLWYEFLVDKQRTYSYYIEVSINGQDWERVIDHSNYNCRAFQRLWILPRIVRYIHFVGTNSTANATFKVWDVCYNTKDMHKLEIKNGFVVPKDKYNVASTLFNDAFVIKGENSIQNSSLLNDYYESYARNDTYTYHLLGSGSIVVHLAQPYILNSMRMLLWGDDDQAYTVETSVNNQKWKMIVDKSEEPTRSWQLLIFKPRLILYIRITGVYSLAGNYFRCVYLEAPAQVTFKSDVVENDRAEQNIL